MKDYNLIATTDRLTVSEACSELWMLLREAGDLEPIVDRSNLKGLVKAKTCIETMEIISKIRSILQESPNKFRTIYRIIPIQRTYSTRSERQLPHIVELLMIA